MLAFSKLTNSKIPLMIQKLLLFICLLIIGVTHAVDGQVQKEKTDSVKIKTRLEFRSTTNDNF